MKILVLDAGGGVGLDFAFRCKLAGHDVKLYLKPYKHPDTGKGVVTRVNDWRPHMKWADLIFMTDNTKYQRELSWFFKEGYPIFGTNPQAAALELDRAFGMRVMEAHGIPVPAYTEFHSYDDAIAHVRKHNCRFVSKPLGDEENKALSYVAKSPADMIYMLQRWKKNRPIKGGFILQEFIGGIEMGVSGWFGPSGFLSCWEENFEHKKLMNDDKGVNTGEMGTALKYCKESKLADMVLKPLASTLAALDFVGDCDMNCIIDEEGTPWPLEFTVRPGWPSFYIQSYLHKGDPAEWMLDCLQGRDSLKVSYGHAIGVVLTIPDFPYSHLTGEDVCGVPLYGINKGNLGNVRLGEVQIGTAPCMDGDKVVDKEIFVSAGDYLACVVGTGETVDSAREEAYAVVDQLEIPNSLGYRTDIGCRLEKQIPELHKLGFATEWSYE